MIVKSLSRKTPSFAQLIAYFDREEKGVSYVHNCWSQSSLGDRLANEFEDNYQYLPKRKNGNALYHEVIAMPFQPDMSAEQQESILIDLVQKYLDLRARNQMAYAKVHHDRQHIHCHIMIAANEIGSNRRSRRSKAEFQKIKQDLEIYKLEKYGEYFGEKLFDRKNKNSNRQSHKEYEVAKRTGLPTKKQMIQGIVKTAFLNAKNEDELKALLAKSGLKYYTRGKKRTPGVIDQSSGKRYRFKTLLSESPLFDWPQIEQRNEHAPNV